MFTSIKSAAIYGVDGKSIAVEADISSGLPQLQIVGLPDTAVRESVQRVRSAIKNSGFKFPMDRITVNLAPADLRKEGTAFDLAIAAAVLAASRQINEQVAEDALIIGELSLSGEVKAVAGVLAMAEMAARGNIKKLILPEANIKEASWISGLELYGITHLKQLSMPLIPSSFEKETKPDNQLSLLDYADISGQHLAIRAMLIAATGQHNILLSGPPGTGKTMLLKRLPTIMAPLDEQQALEVTKIFSVAGLLSGQMDSLFSTPPFRSPHHSVTAAGLIGGGAVPKPGEITLAHHGILLLDELPEFQRAVLEMLRQPMEEGFITISRSNRSLRFPSRFLLAATCNPCPCGFFGTEHTISACACTPLMVKKYAGRLSGPLLDRFDLMLDVPMPVAQQQSSKDLFSKTPVYTSAELKQTVLQARAFAAEQQRIAADHLFGSTLRKHSRLNKAAEQMLNNAYHQLGLSLRTYDKMIRVGRTIADLEQSDMVQCEHIAEALQFRKTSVAEAILAYT